MDIYSGASGVIRADNLLIRPFTSGAAIVKSAGSGSFVLRNYRRRVLDLAVSTSLVQSDAGSIVTNESAATDVVFNLPYASGADGIAFDFIRASAASELQINPQDSEAITWSSGTMSNGEELELLSLGASVSLVARNNGWLVYKEFGNITEETP